MPRWRDPTPRSRRVPGNINLAGGADRHRAKTGKLAALPQQRDVGVIDIVVGRQDWEWSRHNLRAHRNALAQRREPRLCLRRLQFHLTRSCSMRQSPGRKRNIDPAQRAQSTCRQQSGSTHRRTCHVVSKAPIRSNNPSATALTREESATNAVTLPLIGSWTTVGINETTSSGIGTV